MTSNKHNFEVVIRPGAKIKSRQWWNKNLLCIKNILSKHLPKRKIRLCKQSSLTLLITNDREIRDLNKKYRKINRPTDVLSFHLNKNEQIKKKYLGDIVISTQHARSQASKKTVAIENELQMLLIHSYLHLLGYDHKSAKEAKSMFSLQNKILLKLNFCQCQGLK